MKPFSSSHVLVASAVRDCASYIEADHERLAHSFAGFAQVSFLFIESDSNDDTLAILRKLENSHSNILVISLGNLEVLYSCRIERLASCRNAYLSELATNPMYSGIDYLAVADLDGVNHLLTSASVESCWGSLEWDVVTANQVCAYYDIYALRHPLWNPTNPADTYNFYIRQGMEKNLASYISTKAKMLKIPEKSRWIEVQSAFGGLAIYKREALVGARYSHLSSDGMVECEHVSLHRILRQYGARIYINPSLINSCSVEHSAGAISHPELSLMLLALKLVKGRVYSCIRALGRFMQHLSRLQAKWQ